MSPLVTQNPTFLTQGLSPLCIQDLAPLVLAQDLSPLDIQALFPLVLAKGPSPHLAQDLSALLACHLAPILSGDLSLLAPGLSPLQAQSLLSHVNPIL